MLVGILQYSPCHLLLRHSNLPHPPWLWAVTLAVRGWTLTLTIRPPVLQTTWLPWRQKSRTAQLPTAWGIAGLRSRELIRCDLIWLGGSCRFRREALTCRQAQVEATHTSPLELLAGQLWSLNVCQYQTLRWGSHFYFYHLVVIKLRKRSEVNLQRCRLSADLWFGHLLTWMSVVWCDRWYHSREWNTNREKAAPLCSWEQFITRCKYRIAQYLHCIITKERGAEGQRATWQEERNTRRSVHYSSISSRQRDMPLCISWCMLMQHYSSFYQGHKA